MMYEGIRGALASDGALADLNEETRFRVRETPAWKKHAADLEAVMLRRGMLSLADERHKNERATN